MDNLLTIYKASAGSGKTFTLTVEYILQLLSKNAEREFEHILAVTFTNKATAEMKARIVETLYGLSHRLEETDDYLEEILLRRKKAGKPLTEQQVREQATRALTAILHDYSHFRVETIDAFFQSILRCMARELGLAASLQVELSHKEVVDNAVDMLIETMGDNPEVTRWVKDYVNDQLDNGERWDIAGLLKDFAGNIFGEEYQQRSEAELERLSGDEMDHFIKHLKRIKREKREQMQAEADKVIAMIENGPVTFDLISNGNNLRKFLTALGELSAKGPSQTIKDQAEGKRELLTAKYRKDHALGDAANLLRGKLQDLLALYDSCTDYFSAKLALTHLNSLRLLRSIDQCAREICSDNGRFTLSSTPALLKKMVESSDAPFIFEKIGTRLNYVMIDEFQDTSHMQWENFKKLLFEKISSGGKGLLVGDIKQSIYRWRSGDWKILHYLQEETELKRFHIQPETLGYNFRSKQHIIDFNNAFFPSAADCLDAIDSDSTIRLKDIYSSVAQRQKHEPDGCGAVGVTIFKSRAKDDDYYDRTVRSMMETVTRLHASGIPYAKMAILVRTNKEINILVNGFHRLNPDIALISGEAFLLEASRAVQMLIAAMRLLIDKDGKDGISEKFLMLHYQRDVLGKSEEELSLQQIVLQNAKEMLPQDFTDERETLRRLPLYILCERLYRIFRLDNIHGEEVFVLTFLDEVQNHLRSNPPDIKTFLTAWDETLHRRPIPSSEMDGICILTIHKSKGLEFHSVLLPFCDWSIESDMPNDILWCKTEVQPFEAMGALPIPIRNSAEVKRSFFKDAYRMEHLERRVDALNLLYVAFTRASSNLFIWGKSTCETGDLTNRSTAGDLIFQALSGMGDNSQPDYFCYQTGEVHSPSQKNKKDSKNRLALNHTKTNAIDVRFFTKDPSLAFRQSNQAQNFLQALEEEENSDSAETLHMQLSQREVGTRMHSVLSRIASPDQLEEVLRTAREDGTIGEGSDWDAILERVREGFRDPLIASWFQADNDIYCECGIASRDTTGKPCVLRPDRVIMKNNRITVIDYKFGRPSRYYHSQVIAYMDLIQRMYPQSEVCGYLWYVMGKGPDPVKRN